ncbi:UDP-N-acetylmuramoyl-tripeptide--D-alanyl-D-alanine ligase [Ilumatobacter sp.]|uniref:UDP-N-acetylmuramoyl-tripeptide--D-alanyl-D- alanine ligase n=1 Tax=Ilumatobacter sp. TaxID=1967498 RepID=UPI003AF927B6
MRLLASQVADATGGRLAGPDVEIDGASFDSRSTRPGELFVPIVAERDGHDYIDAAVAAGAVAYLTTEEPAVDGTSIEVLDTAEALMMLAAWARTLLDIPVVGVTGSVGKTSTKDLTAAALGATHRVTANERSFNNEQGLPVTILGTPDDAEVLVVEMGMRGFGEIARLCRTARPTIGVVTAVAASHTERVGGIEGVAMAKRELVETLPDDGTAVLNADDERVAAMRSSVAGSVVTYGRAGDVRLAEVTLDDLARPRISFETPWGAGEVQLSVSGAHMAANAAAAVAVAGVVTGGIDGALAALAEATVSGMRMQLDRTASGAVVVNDAYNANPDSMRAALDALAAIRATRRVAVLGLMAELDDPAAGHRRVMADAIERGIDVVAVGTDLYGVAPVDDPIAALGPLGEGDAVLVKASRAAGLERWATQLLGA